MTNQILEFNTMPSSLKATEKFREHELWSEFYESKKEFTPNLGVAYICEDLERVFESQEGTVGRERLDLLRGKNWEEKFKPMIDNREILIFEVEHEKRLHPFIRQNFTRYEVYRRR